MNGLKKAACIIRNGCVIFTVMTLASYSAGALISNGKQSFIPSLKWIWLFFVFSSILAAAGEVFRCRRLALWLRLLIHLGASLSAYTVVVILCGGFYKNGSQILISLAAFILAYGIFALFQGVRLRSKEKKLSDSSAYTSKFN